MRFALAVALALTLSAGCARVTVQMQPGQTEEIANRAHAVCFDESHSYAGQLGATLMFGPLLYAEKGRQNQAYVECMAARGFVVSYREGMGYHPDLTLEMPRE